MNSTAPLTTLRPATLNDARAIHDLLVYYASRGNLLPRTHENLCRHIRDFVVLEEAGKIVASGALEVMSNDLGEIRSLVVDADQQRRGLGQQVAARLIEMAAEIGLKRVMALTYVPEFFTQLQFEQVERESLPEKIWQVCVKCYKFDHCDEIAMIRKL
ncbi:MAG: N-acetyltransferase [Immundisolibacteraceae bacterium]|nr:N-acetyltransferase [Immundisolibacteraceae bacterium]